jgi:quinolinate synthase
LIKISKEISLTNQRKIIMDMVKEIKKLAAEKNAVILAHNYQNGEIQDVAHINGDSLQLAREAADTHAEIIVFCGVHFMAESAAMLSPEKKVILPVLDAGCPMADMVDPQGLRELKEEHPDAMVVTYINSSAEVKALSDVICTSSNAVNIVRKVDAQKIIFTPDKNLAAYVQRFTEKEVIPWKGFCPTHENFTLDDLLKIKGEHPHALVMVHPECRAEVIDNADEVLSTGQMVKFVEKTDAKKIIVGTESGMIHRLKAAAPGVEFIPASGSFICFNMKKISLEKLYHSLLNESPVITVNKDVREKAVGALNRMLELSE